MSSCLSCHGVAEGYWCVRAGRQGLRDSQLSFANLAGAQVQVGCPGCGHSNAFDQPYAYHAGFGDQGFLYNGAGDCTLVWSIYDKVYEAMLAQYSCEQPWALTELAKREFEATLPPSPHGDRWRFGNPARCQTYVEDARDT